MTESKLQPKYVPREYLSVSTLVNFARCKRRYFYSKSGLRSPGVMVAPEYGKAMHVGVPVALETEDASLAFKMFCSIWEETETKLTGEDWLEARKKGKTRECAERSLKHFVHTHAGKKSIYKLIDPPEGALPLDEKDSRYEVPWALDIGLRVPLVGRFDGMCRHRDTNGLWIWEFKTASRINAQFFDAHEMYTQNLTYTLVGQTLVDEPVEGVMLEGMLTNPKNVDNIVQPLPTLQHHLEDTLRWVHDTGKELLDCEDKIAEGMSPEEAFPKDFCGCTPYTHYYVAAWRCEYADLCRVPDWCMMQDLYEVVPDHKFLGQADQEMDLVDAARKLRQAG
jgi:hypothetical protein